jgi:hypothetical protein
MAAPLDRLRPRRSFGLLIDPVRSRPATRTALASLWKGVSIDLMERKRLQDCSESLYRVSLRTSAQKYHRCLGDGIASCRLGFRLTQTGPSDHQVKQLRTLPLDKRKDINPRRGSLCRQVGANASCLARGARTGWRSKVDLAMFPTVDPKVSRAFHIGGWTDSKVIAYFERARPGCLVDL